MEPVIGRPPIHKAAKKLDLVALRRELDAGVSPDLLADPYNNGSLRLPLQDAIVYAWLEQSPYLRKIVEYPGGFRAYALAHRQRLTAIFLPKFPFLPAEIVSHIVSFGFNCGCYEFDAAAAIEPVAHRTRSKGG